MITKDLYSGFDGTEEVHAQRERTSGPVPTTLAAFIYGIVASGSTQLPKVARKIFSEAYPASREKYPDCIRAIHRV